MKTAGRFILLLVAMVFAPHTRGWNFVLPLARLPVRTTHNEAR
jgi:hypothetical protein